MTEKERAELLFKQRMLEACNAVWQDYVHKHWPREFAVTTTIIIPEHKPRDRHVRLPYADQ